MKAGFGSSAGGKAANPRFVPPSTAELARLFPHLEVLELIGSGGMGAVYKARQPGLDRLVAVKILPPETTTDTGFAERFAREARALAKLNHPNIVSVYEFGDAGGLHYFVMEYVDGLNLRQLVQRGRLSAREALQIVPQMCDALQFAHDEGVVHRDIKPENVMVDKRGRVKITDFGLAKLLGREPEALRLTGAKDVMGTPNYMAPEQMEKPDAVDHRADIYSLGVVFYELLTGELPVGRFAPPSQKVSLDVRLDEVVLHALEKEPARRYQHASQVKSDVETITHTPSATSAAIEAKSPETLRVAEAFRQVKGPAGGLILTGILNWLGIPLLVLVVVYFQHRGGYLLAIPLAAMGLSSLMLVAGIKMKRLQSYWLAITGSLAAMFVTPGNLVGLPIGIWSLVVLTQTRVRQCFGTEEPMPATGSSTGGGSWKPAAIIAGAVLLVCAIPVGAIFAAMVLPALSRAKEASKYAVRFQEVREVVLHQVRAGVGGEALDLDSGSLFEVPSDVSRNEADLAGYVSNKGLDLILSRDEKGTCLVTSATNQLQLVPAPNGLWRFDVHAQPETPDTLKQIVRGGTPWVSYVLNDSLQLPLTFSFETGNGAKGLLQITALEGSPLRANIRFKKFRE